MTTSNAAMLCDIARLISSPPSNHTTTDDDVVTTPHQRLRYQAIICQAGRMGYEALYTTTNVIHSRQNIIGNQQVVDEEELASLLGISIGEKDEESIPSPKEHEDGNVPSQEVTQGSTGTTSSPSDSRRVSIMSTSTRSWARRLSVAPSRPPTTLVVDRISTHLLTESLKQEGIYHPHYSPNWVYVADTSSSKKAPQSGSSISNEASSQFLQSSQLTGFGSHNSSGNRRGSSTTNVSTDDGGKEQPGSVPTQPLPPGLVVPLAKSGGKKRPTGLSHSSIVSLLGLGGQPRGHPQSDMAASPTLEHSSINMINAGKEEKYSELVETLRMTMNTQLNNTIGRDWELHQHLHNLEQRRKSGGRRKGFGNQSNSLSLSSSSQGAHPNTDHLDALTDALHCVHTAVEIHKDERRQKRKAQRVAIAKQCAAAERSIRGGGEGSNVGHLSPHSHTSLTSSGPASPTTMMRRRQVSVVAPGEEPPPRPPPMPQFTAPVVDESPSPPTANIVPASSQGEEASDDSLFDAVSTASSSSSSEAAPDGDVPTKTKRRGANTKMKASSTTTAIMMNTNSSSSPEGALKMKPTMEDFMGSDPAIPLNENTVEMCMDAILDNFKTSVELSQTRKRHIRRWRLGNFEKLLLESEKLERKGRDGQTATTIVDRSNQRAMKVATRKTLIGSTTTTNATNTKITESKKRLVVSVENGDECSDSLSQTSSELSDDDAVYFEHPLFSSIVGHGNNNSKKAARKSSLDHALGVVADTPTTMYEAVDVNPRIPRPEVVIQLHSPLTHSTNITTSSSSAIYHTPALRGDATVLLLRDEQEHPSSATPNNHNILTPILSTTGGTCNVHRYKELTTTAAVMDPDAASRVQSTLQVFHPCNPPSTSITSTPSSPSSQGGLKVIIPHNTTSSPSVVRKSTSSTEEEEQQQQHYDIVSIKDMEHFDFYSRTTTLLAKPDKDGDSDNNKNDDTVLQGYFDRRAVILRETIPLQRQCANFMKSVHLEDNRPISFQEILNNSAEGCMDEEHEEGVSGEVEVRTGVAGNTTTPTNNTIPILPTPTPIAEAESLLAVGTTTPDDVDGKEHHPTIPLPPTWDASVLEAGIPAQQFPLHVSKQLSLLLPTTADASLKTAKAIVTQLDKVMSTGSGLSVQDWQHRKMVNTRDILESVNVVFPSASSNWIKSNDLSIPRTTNNTRLEGKKLRRRLQLQREKLSKKFKEKALTSTSKGSTTHVPTAKEESTRISHLLQLLTEHLLNTAAVDRSQASEVSGTILHPPTILSLSATSSNPATTATTKRRSTTVTNSSSTRKSITPTVPPSTSAPTSVDNGAMYVPSFRGSVRDIIKYVDAIDAINIEAAAKQRDTAAALQGRSISSSTLMMLKQNSQHKLQSTSETKLQKLRIRELSIVAASMGDMDIDDDDDGRHHHVLSADTLDYRKTEHMYVLPEDILRPLLNAHQPASLTGLDTSFGADLPSQSYGEELPMLQSVSSGLISATWNPNATVEGGGGPDEANSLTRDQVIGCHAPNTITFQNVMSNLQQLFTDAAAVDLEHELERKEREEQRRLEALQVILGEVEREEEAARNKLSRDLLREYSDFLDATKIKFIDGKKALAHAGIHEKLMRAKKAMSSALGSGFGSAQKSSGDGLFAIVKSAQQKNIGRLKVLDELSLSSSSSGTDKGRGGGTPPPQVVNGSITAPPPQRGRKSSMTTRERQGRRGAGLKKNVGGKSTTPPPTTTTPASSSRPSLLSQVDGAYPSSFPAQGETTTLLTFPAFTVESIDTPAGGELSPPAGLPTVVSALFIQLEDITIRYSAPNPLQLHHPTDACLLEESDYFIHSHLTAPPVGPHGGLSQFRREKDAIPMLDLVATDEELDALFAQMDDVVGPTPPSTPLSGLPRGPVKAPPKPTSSTNNEHLKLTSSSHGDSPIRSDTTPPPRESSLTHSRDDTTTNGGIQDSYIAFGDQHSAVSGLGGGGDDEDDLHGSMLSISEPAHIIPSSPHDDATTTNTTTNETSTTTYNNNNSSTFNTNNSYGEEERVHGRSSREKSIAKSQSQYDDEDALLNSMMIDGSTSFRTAISKHKSLFAARKALHKEQQEAGAAEQARIKAETNAEADRLALENKEREEAGLAFRSEVSGTIPARNTRSGSLPFTPSLSDIISSTTTAKPQQQRRLTVKFDVDANKSSRDNSVTSTTLEQRSGGVLPRVSVYGVPLDMVSPPSSPRNSEGPLSSLAAAMAGTSYTAEQLRNQMLAARTAKERAIAQQSIDDAVEKERVAQETHGFLRALAGESPVSSSIMTPLPGGLLSPSDQSLFNSVFTDNNTNNVGGGVLQGSVSGNMEGAPDKDLLKSIKRANKRHQQSGGDRHNNNQVFKSTKARNRTPSMELAADELRDEMSAIQLCKEFPSQRLIQHYLRFTPLGATVAALMRPTDSVVMGALAAKRKSDGGSKLNWKPTTRLVPTAPVILKMKFVGNGGGAASDNNKSTTAAISAPTIQCSLIHPPRPSADDDDDVEGSFDVFDESPLFFATGTTSSVLHTTQLKSLGRTDGDVVDTVLSQIETLKGRIAAQKAIFEQGRRKEEITKSMLQRAVGNLREGRIVPPHKPEGLYSQGDIIKCGPYSPHFLPSSRPLTAASTGVEVSEGRSSSGGIATTNNSRSKELALQENIQRDLVKVGEARRTPQPFGIRVPIEPEFKTEKQKLNSSVPLSSASSSSTAVDVSLSRMGREQTKRMFIAKNAHQRPLLAPIHGIASRHHHHHHQQSAADVDTSMTVNGKSRGGTAPPQTTSSSSSSTRILNNNSNSKARQLTPLVRSQRPTTMLAIRGNDDNGEEDDVDSLADTSFICRSYPTPTGGQQQQHFTPIPQHRADTPSTPFFLTNVAQLATHPNTAAHTISTSNNTTNTIPPPPLPSSPPPTAATTSRKAATAMADRVLDIQSEIGKLLQGLRWEAMREE